MKVSGAIIVLSRSNMKVLCHSRVCVIWGLMLATVVFYQAPLMALTINEAVDTVANKLWEHQIKDGITVGYWPGEMSLTGSIVAGMVSAYELGCNVDYKESAELGGDFILWVAQDNFYGDEIYALMRLSQISSDPCDNPWRSAVSDFYESVKNSAGGTENYISNFYAIESSTAVFFLANHVMAAYYVDAADKKIWRQKLINFLSRVDDSSYYPVMALGAASAGG